jgi:hypothetical protein
VDGRIGAVGEWYLWSISALACLPFPPKKSGNGDGHKTQPARVVSSSNYREAGRELVLVLAAAFVSGLFAACFFLLGNKEIAKKVVEWISGGLGKRLKEAGGWWRAD